VSFEGVEVDFDRFEVRRDGEALRVQPQVFSVMTYLMEHRHRVVPKEELLDNVWGDRFVSESALTSRIKSARQTLGDDGKQQRIIATVHGRGYRFLAEPERIPGDDDDVAPDRMPVARRSVGVAPPVLVEREAAMDVLASAYEDVCGGAARIVVLRGEAGIGKSALLQTFVDRLPADVRVAVTATVALRSPQPLGPMIDVLTQLGVGATGSPPGSPNAAVTLLTAALRRGSAPVVLMFDDVHWADDASLDALALLARMGSDLSMLLLIAARDGEIAPDHPLWPVLAVLRSQGAVVVDLQPLGLEGIDQLIGSEVDPTALLARTGGNPFLIKELVDSPGDDVPAGVSDVVLARLARLTPAARRGVELLAMSPVPVELSVCAVALGAEVAALGEAERVGLLRSTGDAVRFEHELLRDAVHASVPPIARIPLHRRLLEALAPTAEPAQVLHHAEAGFVTDVIVSMGPGAARHAAQVEAHREACITYERVLRYAHVLDPRELASLTSEYAYQLYLVWDLQRATSVAELAVRRWHDLGDAGEEGSALTTLARTMAWSDRTRALEAAERAVALLEPLGASRPLARAWCELASVHAMEQRFDAAVHAATRGEELAIEVADRGLQALALNYLGCAASATGDDRWEQLLRRSIDLASGAQPREYAIRACSNMAVAYWDMGRWNDAAEVVSEGERMIADVDYQASAVTLKVQAAHVAMASARYRDALATIDWILAGNRAASHELELEVLRRRAMLRLGDPDAGGELRGLWREHRTGEDTDSLARRAASGRRDPLSYTHLLLLTGLAELAFVEGDTALATEVATTVSSCVLKSPWRSELAELTMYLSLLPGFRIEEDDLLEPFASAIRGEFEIAATGFDEAGRPYEADVCRAAARSVRQA
jgi:DNA-binding winged helix-turn-helix (wHTH) protein/tetratricopeptide (TPR) repeat protein